MCRPMCKLGGCSLGDSWKTVGLWIVPCLWPRWCLGLVENSKFPSFEAIPNKKVTSCAIAGQPLEMFSPARRNPLAGALRPEALGRWGDHKGPSPCRGDLPRLGNRSESPWLADWTNMNCHIFAQSTEHARSCIFGSFTIFSPDPHWTSIEHEILKLQTYYFDVFFSPGGLRLSLLASRLGAGRKRRRALAAARRRQRRCWRRLGRRGAAPGAPRGAARRGTGADGGAAAAGGAKGQEGKGAEHWGAEVQQQCWVALSNWFYGQIDFESIPKITIIHLVQNSEK